MRAPTNSTTSVVHASAACVVCLVLLFNLSTAFRIYDIDLLPVMPPVVDKRAADDEMAVISSALVDGQQEDAIRQQQAAETADDSLMTSITTRRKRYTDYQDNALAICAGDCMYQRRTTYGECYDLCDWNGRTPSPWKKLDQKQQQQQQQQQSSVPQIYRSGQRKGSSSIAAFSSPSSAARGQQRGKTKIKVKAGRPRTSRPRTSDGGRRRPQNKKTGSRRRTSAGARSSDY